MVMIVYRIFVLCFILSLFSNCNEITYMLVWDMYFIAPMGFHYTTT